MLGLGFNIAVAVIASTLIGDFARGRIRTWLRAHTQSDATVTTTRLWVSKIRVISVRGRMNGYRKGEA